MIAFVSMLLLGFGMSAKADYGVTSKQPLSDPAAAKIDERPTGTWRAVIRDKTYYLHVGTGNIVGKFNWMELVLVNPGKEKPMFYLHHHVGFASTIGDESFFNIAYMSKLIPQLRGSKIEDLLPSVERYDILKYELTGDYLDIWSADQKLIREAIKSGKIKGTEGKVDDTAENIVNFIKSSGDKLYVKKFRYTRVKEPAPKPSEESSKTQSPSEPEKPATKP